MKLGMAPENIRQNNQINVIKILIKKPYTHKQLANKLKLSNTAIQNIVSSLQSKNLIIETKQLVNKTGRPSILVALNVNNFYTIKITFEKDNSLDVAAHDFSKKLLLNKTAEFEKYNTDELNDVIAKLINEIIADPSLKNKTLCNIVIAAPGIVNNDNLIVTTALNNNAGPYDPYSFLKEKFACDIIISDDKLNYTQGELTNNKELNKSNVILFFQMPAPSISLVVNKSIYRGANGFFGEIGFVSENITTAQKINFRAQNQTNIDHSLSLIKVISKINSELPQNETKLRSISDVAELLKQEHPLVTEKISKHCDRLCSFILNLCILFDFDTLVFPGEFAPLKDYYFEKLQHSLTEYAFTPVKLLIGRNTRDASNNGILDMAIERGLTKILSKD